MATPVASLIEISAASDKLLDNFEETTCGSFSKS
jgi:hypothetical protein